MSVTAEVAGLLRTLDPKPGAENEALRSAYRQMMAQYHPDKVATLAGC